MRIMLVRDTIAEQTLEFLPEMVTSGIKSDNLTHRRHLLERLTRTTDEAMNLDISEASRETEDFD